MAPVAQPVCTPGTRASLPRPLHPEVAPLVDVCSNIDSVIRDPSYALINALDHLPECDARDSARMHKLGTMNRASKCAVYCAQPTCSAAVDFINANHAQLFEKCDSVTYMHDGALHADANLLRDGVECHRRIAAYNKSHHR